MGMTIKFRKRLKTKEVKFSFKGKPASGTYYIADRVTLFFKGVYDGCALEAFVFRGDKTGELGGAVADCDTLSHQDVRHMARALAAACKFNKVKAVTFRR